MTNWTYHPLVEIVRRNPRVGGQYEGETILAANLEVDVQPLGGAEAVEMNLPGINEGKQYSYYTIFELAGMEWPLNIVLTDLFRDMNNINPVTGTLREYHVAAIEGWGRLRHAVAQLLDSGVTT